MLVGAAVVEIHIHGSRSLKERRGVVRSISQRVRNRFNVSVAEVGGQDTWTQAMIGVSAAGSQREPLRKVLRRVIEFIEDLHLAEVVNSDIEIVQLPLEGEAGAELEVDDRDADVADPGENEF